MVKRQLIKPRKVVWVMRDFINEIHHLTYTQCFVSPMREDESIDEFFERFKNMEEREMPSKVKMVYREKGFAVWPNDIGEAEFHLFYNIEELWCKGSKQFSQDFFSRCPAGRGFASVTLTILHELGHLHAQQEFEGYNRFEAIKNLEKTSRPKLSTLNILSCPMKKPQLTGRLNG